MNINLSGVNVPTKVLNQLLLELPEDRREYYKERLTPIIIAAASARISRDPHSIEQLIDEAIEDVPKAKKSAQNIAFGMSHRSIADHVMFNFSIENVSRLAIEAIEERRIGSGYTEKSQRYITLDGDFVMPEEFSLIDKERFAEFVELQNRTYFELKDKILKDLKQRFPDASLKDLEGRAKEDARYVLSLATEGQLTCSYDGEAAEHAIRNMRYSELAEVRKISQGLEKAVKDYIEVVQLVDKEAFKGLNNGKEPEEDFFKFTKKNLKSLVNRAFNKDYSDKIFTISPISLRKENAVLIENQNTSENILAALLFTHSKEDIHKCYRLANLFSSSEEGFNFMKDALKYLSEFDKVPREFEIGNLIFSAEISSSCFAQLKRHRMATLLKQDYNPNLGVVVPESVRDINQEGVFNTLMEFSQKLYEEFLPKYGSAAEYCLTNAHKRRVIFSLNIRELYHFSRTREDGHAQWEIKSLANNMCDIVKRRRPLSAMLLGGKDKFSGMREQVYRD